MKICWDNLQNIFLTKYGNFRNKKNGKVYMYMESCKNCGEPYLGARQHILKGKGLFCDNSCASSGENHSQYGIKQSDERKEKTASKLRGRKRNLNQKGSKNPNWKGGVWKKQLSPYDTHAEQLSYAEKVRKTKEGWLEVKCAYCGKWFLPNRNAVRNRINALEGKSLGEYRFYCSDGCKTECPIYRKTPESIMKEDGIKAGNMKPKELGREIQPELRQMVFERDDWTCQKCGSKDNLHCHHITGVEINPIESADVDNCTTFCKECHKEIHSEKGCSYYDMRRKICK